MIQEMTEPFTWEKYGKRIKHKITHTNGCGNFENCALEGRNLRLISVQSGAIERGSQLAMYWLVDLEDGSIVDAKYELFGTSILVAILEACIEIIVGKNYDQARRVSQDVIDKHLRESSEITSLPFEAAPYVGLVLDVLDLAANQCSDISLASSYQVTPLPEHLLESQGGIPNWPEMPMGEKLAVVQAVVERDIRPYVEMDAGGVEVLRIQNNHEVVIAYSGSCTSCFSATGSTLSSIQAILRAKVHPSIEVTPEL